MSREITQRELKFRAWDTVNKRWLCHYEELGGFSLTGECVVFGELASQMGSIDKWNEIVIDQFTGTQDKNNVDVYESDIIRSGYLFYQVIFRPPAFRLFKSPKDKYGYLLDSKKTYQQIEVIGNIHQNSDLLK